LIAVFDSWYIPDGNYPPLRKGQRVNLSFEAYPVNLDAAEASDSRLFENFENAQCSFVAEVIRRYGYDEQIAVLDAGNFRFYVHGPVAERLCAGDVVRGSGTLCVDHYLWVEFLYRYPDPPDIFYNSEVRRIRMVTFQPGDNSKTDVEELETMEGQDFDKESYILDFDTAGLENEKIARTFL
jgi:hypothetical protein